VERVIPVAWAAEYGVEKPTLGSVSGFGYARYVALGDSQTEGIGDGDEERGYRGWADRLAERLASLYPGLRYANLAVRGKLAREIRAEQLTPALALRPDLATVMAGVNDLLRRRFDGDLVEAELDAMYGALTAAGARVATVTFPDIGELIPLARPLRPRVLRLNAAIRDAAARHGVHVVDTFNVPVATDPRIWSPDRLHASPLGHARIADAVAHALRLPGSDDWTTPLPTPAPVRTVRTELRWCYDALGPWLSRRLRGQAHGAGRLPKRPHLRPMP
jgi:lysophospholipase L1-like esterase